VRGPAVTPLLLQRMSSCTTVLASAACELGREWPGEEARELEPELGRVLGSEREAVRNATRQTVAHCQTGGGVCLLPAVEMLHVYCSAVLWPCWA
jgi:hypothetical protein